MMLLGSDEMEIPNLYYILEVPLKKNYQILDGEYEQMIITLSHFSMFFQARRIPYGPKNLRVRLFISLPVDLGSHPHPSTHPTVFPASQVSHFPASPSPPTLHHLLHLHILQNDHISSPLSSVIFHDYNLYDCWLNVRNSGKL